MKDGTNILNDIAQEIEDIQVVENSHFEDLSSTFSRVVKTRRSVRIFTEEPIADEIVRECLEMALLAPNSSNLQPWQFYWIKNKNLAKEISKYCFSQPAATTAQALIVCVARTDTWKKHRNQILEHFKTMQKVPKSAMFYYQKLVPFVYGQGFLGLKGLLKKCIFYFGGIFKVVPREPTSRSQMISWAHKSTALACENLMLAFRSYGYDTCPMEGFDAKKVKKILNLPRNAHITMIIGAGRMNPKGLYGPQLRMDSKQFIFEVD